jgi:glycosyltransferase involved in cell wall biosynthesis
MISIVAVNHNTRDWAELLIQSVRKFTHLDYELVIIDNASKDGSAEWLSGQKDIIFKPLGTNIGHGQGLDFAMQFVKGKYCFAFDIDTHVQREGWETDLIALYNSDYRIRLVAAKGGKPDDSPPKPIHPCWMLYERAFFKDWNLSFVARDGYDVGRKIYYDIVKAGFKVFRIDSGYEPDGSKFYPGSFGTEYYIGGQPSLYHEWYSARMWQKKQVDNYKREDFERNKQAVFGHPLVKDILAWKK